MSKSRNKDEDKPVKRTESADKETDSEPMSPGLMKVIERLSFGLDEKRPDAVARRHQEN